MVWGLFPVESLPGEQKYFIFSKGTYKVGRRGCDVIINTDKGVSRVHAEVVVNSMTSLDPLHGNSSNFSLDVHIKDLSKYGTFINKKQGSKAKDHDHPNKETTLKDGDLISFGTGNATYRFCFVPLIFFVYRSIPPKVDRSLQEQISSIGASATHNWKSECTHALVDDSGPVEEDLLDAIMAQKPVILSKWIKVVAEKNISFEFPSFADYLPTLMLEGSPVKVVDPKSRENCLAGYTFLFGELYLYTFGEQLQSLLDVAGSKYLSVDGFCSTSQWDPAFANNIRIMFGSRPNQASQDGASNRVVLVIPARSENQFNGQQHIRSLPRLTDVKLISAILSGQLDPSAVESPPILVLSSCSTDETIVADSDVEMDTATTHGVTANAHLVTPKNEDEPTINVDIANDPTINDEAMPPVIHANSPTSKFQSLSSKVEDGVMIEKMDKDDEYDTSVVQNSDIIYTQDLIIRDTNPPASFVSTTIRGVVNFKCFRRRETESGNSYRCLIPFSKNPYRESEYGNEEVAEHVKEEKKRKQMEAISEDLFNNDKSRRRGAAGTSIRELLTRG